MPATVEIVFDRSQEILALISESVGAAVRETAEKVQGAAKELIHTSPASGRTYISTSRPSPHRASAPGEPPANWTGVLAASVKTRVEGETESSVYVDESEAPYGHDLEMGSASGRVAPRPWMRPAADAEEPEFAPRVADAVKRVTGG